MLKEIENIIKSIPSGLGVEIPPKIFVDMGSEIIDYEDKKSLTVKMPIKEKYKNPLGFMQGGMIAAAIDNTVGPLSFLVAPPSVTTTMNLTYHRPIPISDEFIFVKATIIDQTKKMIYIKAEVFNKENKLKVTATTSFIII
jgi:uncharacterized protein (TIGR00369 family)